MLMTDDEIIKALEYCSYCDYYKIYYSLCAKCAYSKTKECKRLLHEDALELIKTLKK